MSPRHTMVNRERTNGHDTSCQRHLDWFMDVIRHGRPSPCFDPVLSLEKGHDNLIEAKHA